jgi:hypothetical protein
MNADQRRLFEETLAEDEAALRAQLERLRREAEAAAAAAGTKPKAPPRKPRRKALPEHLPPNYRELSAITSTGRSTPRQIFLWLVV